MGARSLKIYETGDKIVLQAGGSLYECTFLDTVEVTDLEMWVRIGLPELKEGDRLVVAKVTDQWS